MTPAFGAGLAICFLPLPIHIPLAALVAIWQVWPVDLSWTWDLAARLAVGAGIVGSVIGIVAAVVRFVRELSASR